MSAEDHLLLTGATGFFGRALLRHWAASGPPTARVTALSRDPEAFARSHPALAGLPWLHWHAGDIGNPDSLPQQTRFSHLLHAAADSTFGPRLTPLQRFEQIVQGTQHLLELAVRCQARRFLLNSSAASPSSVPTCRWMCISQSAISSAMRCLAFLAYQVRDPMASGTLTRIQQSDQGGPRNRYVPSMVRAAQKLCRRITFGLPDAIRAPATAHLSSS